MARYVSRLSTELHKLSGLGHYALRSFPNFLRDVFDAENLVLDRALLRFSPLPKVPVNLMEKLQAHGVILPPRGFLEDGTQSIEGLYFLASLSRALNVRQAFEIRYFHRSHRLDVGCECP